MQRNLLFCLVETEDLDEKGHILKDKWFAWTKVKGLAFTKVDSTTAITDFSFCKQKQPAMNSHYVELASYPVAGWL